MAVDDFPLNLKYGEIHVLVGENDALNATLMRVLVCIYIKDKGKTVFDGEPWKRLKNPRKEKSFRPWCLGDFCISDEPKP